MAIPTHDAEVNAHGRLAWKMVASRFDQELRGKGQLASLLGAPLA